MPAAPLAPYLGLLAGVIAYSTSGVLAKLCGAPPVTMAFWVRAFSLTYLVTVLLLREGRRAPRLVRRAAAHGLGGGLIFGLHIIAYFAALKLTDVTVVFVVGSLNPAVVAIFGALVLGERLNARRWLWTAVAIAGSIAIVGAADASGEVQLTGNLLAVVSTLGYCAYFLVTRHARHTLGATEYLAVVTAVSLVVAGVVALGSGTSLAIADRRDLMLLALLGLVPATMGHLAVNWALRHVEAHAASTVLLGVPIFASLWAHLFAAERLSPAQIAAGLVILLAIPGAVGIRRRALADLAAGRIGGLAAAQSEDTVASATERR